MAGGEFPRPDQAVPPIGEQPPTPQASHYVAARLSIGMSGDLSAVQRLHDELGEWLQARADLGAVVFTDPDIVSLSYRELDLADTPDQLLSSQEDLQKRLGTTVKDALEKHADLKSGTLRPLVDRLDWGGITEVRDLLVVGRGYVHGTARGGVTREAVQQALSGHVPELEWLEAPTIRDIVNYCDSLDDVTAAALGNYSLAEYAVRTSVEPQRRRRPNERKPRVSAQDVLDNPRAQAYPELIEAASRFEVEFLQARAQRAPDQAR